MQTLLPCFILYVKVKEDILALSTYPVCVDLWTLDPTGEKLLFNVERYNVIGDGTYTGNDWNIKLLESSKGFAGFKTEWFKNEE